MNSIIVVGTDFSDTALHALREARRLSVALGGETEVIHVREGLRRDPWVLSEEDRRWMEEARVDPAILSVRSGTPWVELVRLARERQADLIVVGTHGRTGFQPMALGSTAQRLALLAPRPVLLVGAREARAPSGTEERSVTISTSAGESSPAPKAPVGSGHNHTTRT